MGMDRTKASSDLLLASERSLPVGDALPFATGRLGLWRSEVPQQDIWLRSDRPQCHAPAHATPDKSTRNHPGHTVGDPAFIVSFLIRFGYRIPDKRRTRCQSDRTRNFYSGQAETSWEVARESREARGGIVTIPSGTTTGHTRPTEPRHQERTKPPPVPHRDRMPR